MTKRDKLHAWLLTKGDWVYLREVPYEIFGLTRAACSTALRDLCDFGRADFRIVCNKQYRAVNAPAPGKGPKPPKGLK